MRKILLCGAALLALAACSRDEEVQISDSTQAHWDYENPNWHNQGYSECAGLVQSPIDIVTTATTKATLPAITFNYSSFPVKAVNNGHTYRLIQMEIAASLIMVLPTNLSNSIITDIVSTL